MSEWSGAVPRPAHRTATETASFGRERIVFLASRQAVYQCLSQAAQRHFSGFEVSLVDQFSVGDTPDDVVRLVMLGQGDGWISANSVKECRRRFPAAAIGLVVEDGLHSVEQSILEQRLVQGILPLTLPLDVWLAVMSLLISGGEYLGPEAMGSGHHAGPGRDRPAEYRPLAPDIHHEPQSLVEIHHELRSSNGAHGTSHPDVPPIAALTIRELQILQLVSQGLQNKLIADRMGLSEHTVKAHVHNLIAKLRVTNRTQAAATFLHDHEANYQHRGDSRADARLVDLQGR